LLDFANIDEYQIEITTYCNAACPQCPRNNLGTGINSYMPLTHLPRATIDQAFDAELCQRLQQVFFCGSYGDPIMHPDFLDILRDFRSKNPTLWLYFHTNGGVHDTDYWAEIAKIMNGYGQIDFGIDGLEDTLHLYRRNVKYSRVIENARAFIQAGGRAQWNFIVFRHNQHQVDACEQLARNMGFKGCRAKISKRPLTNKLESPLGWQPSVVLPGKIKCHAEQEKSAYINAQGRLSPCCWLGERNAILETEFKNIKLTWNTDNPNTVCKTTCSTNTTKTSFTNQWQREICLV
jgi:MoaA/NifB/PqqE/SkfB family radical SAM enzyme